MLIDNPLKPLVKWMGGKQRLLGQILDTIYESKYTGTYIEPFLGGGSVLLALLPNRAVINDLNGQLVNLWRCVQSDVEAVIDCWNEIDTVPVTSDHYYQLRDEHNEYRRNDTIGPRAAAVFAWITRHSFNGLYRTKKDGTFNANWNKEEQSRPLPVDNWREVHRYLKNNDILILQGDFDRVVKMAGGGDLVYCDPPYAVGTQEKAYSALVYGGFNVFSDSERVAKVLLDCPASVIVSNNDNDFTRRIYPSSMWNVKTLSLKRSFHGSRGNIDYSAKREVLFTRLNRGESNETDGQ